MLLNLLLLFSVFVKTQATDYASHHVRNYLNNSISPCDNFYRHVCSISMLANETVGDKSAQFYADLAEALASRSLNNAVMSDIKDGRDTISDCWSDTENYQLWLDHRCASDFDCFLTEFHYFYRLYENTMNKNGNVIDDSLKFYAKHGNTTRSISKCKQATSRIVELLYNLIGKYDFEDSVRSFITLQDRLYVIETMTSIDLGVLKEISNLTKKVKQELLRKFKETSWMQVDNEFGFNILEQFEITLNEIKVRTEFDKYDKDMTTLRNINRNMNSRYWEHIKRETGCRWFDVWHAFSTTSLQLNEMDTTSEEEEIYFRLANSLQNNAWNYGESNIILILAPTFYPHLHNASNTTMFAFAGHILGHEMYHSFITEALLNRSEDFKAEAECLFNHYTESCRLFAEGECVSGTQTFYEDGADLEGVRAAYSLLKRKYTSKQLKQYEYPDLKITREQSFFYSTAMRECSHYDHSGEDPHSPANIRVNALVSQMPEFTSAFRCKPDHALFANKENLCYLFGKESKGAVVNGADETVDILTNGDNSTARSGCGFEI